MKTLFDQLNESDAQIAVVGLLVGVDTPGPSFRNYLREVPAFEGSFTLGDAARAYLEHRMSALAA